MCNIYQIFQYLERMRGEKNFQEVLPLFGSFCTKSAKIRQQICPAALLIVRHLTRPAAKQSASWQLCRMRMIIVLDLVECNNKEGPGTISISSREEDPEPWTYL